MGLCLVPWMFVMIGMTNNTDSDEDPTGGIVLWYFVLFVTMCCCFRRCKKNKDNNQRAVQLFLENQNMNHWHARGLHWSIGPNCRYLQLMMNFDANLANTQSRTAG